MVHARAQCNASTKPTDKAAAAAQCVVHGGGGRKRLLWREKKNLGDAIRQVGAADSGAYTEQRRKASHIFRNSRFDCPRTGLGFVNERGANECGPRVGEIGGIVGYYL